MNTKCAAIILSGGQGRRMHYQDKGLVQFKGHPLVSYPVQLLSAQVDELVISANRHLDQYRAFKFPVITDLEQYPEMGPLGGIYSASRQLSDDIEFVQIVPCDTPFLPTNLVQVMHQSLIENQVDITIAASSEKNHPSVLHCKRSVLDSIQPLLDDGSDLSLRAFIKQHASYTVLFDKEDYFINFNDPTVLAQWNQ